MNLNLSDSVVNNSGYTGDNGGVFFTRRFLSLNISSSDLFTDHVKQFNDFMHFHNSAIFVCENILLLLFAQFS